MYRFSILAMAVLANVELAQARTGSWGEYRDATFNCRLEYPLDTFLQDGIDENSKFQRFSGPNEQTFFRVMGISNSDHLGTSEVRRLYAQAGVPGDITYERTRSDFLVISGFRGDSIFYRKISLSDKHICILEIAYPRTTKLAFDSTVTRMSRSFEVGD